MDSTRRLAILRDQKGMALVYVALLMVALFGFLGLAVDIGYMYVAKGQLQNAADAAALAGVTKLDGTIFTTQTSARNTAVRFAAENLAAGSAITVSSKTTSNALSSDNDITVGNWNPVRSPGPPDDRYHQGEVPINAVMVQARRTGSADNGGQSIGGPIDLFFSNVIGWPQMGASATAIASRPPRARFYVMIGRDVCSSVLPLKLSPAPGVNNMAWTSLLQPSTNANDVRDRFICVDKVPNEQVCGNSVYTTNGIASTIFQATETDFYDPDYDSANKQIISGVVSYWDVIVPVSTVSDPSAPSSPQSVWGYAEIRITKACGNGEGNACNSEGRLFTAPPLTCSEDGIFISQINCVSCENSSELLGAKPSLVR